MDRSAEGPGTGAGQDTSASFDFGLIGAYEKDFELRIHDLGTLRLTGAGN